MENQENIAAKTVAADTELVLPAEASTDSKAASSVPEENSDIISSSASVGQPQAETFSKAPSYVDNNALSVDEDSALVTNFDLFGQIEAPNTETEASEQAEVEENDAQNDTEDVDGQLSMNFDSDEAHEEAEAAAPADTSAVRRKSQYDPAHPRKVDTAFDFVELFIFALVAVLLVTTFFFRPSVVEGESMENTLFNGESLIISNVFYEPERGDIVVCYSDVLGKNIVKRVIAIEGDHIVVSPTGHVILNGETLHEDYVFIDAYKSQAPVDVIVPEGEVFVMGDHRNDSYDSRHMNTVDTDYIIGKVVLRVYPFNKFGKVE